MNFSLSELATLIRLVDKELDELHEQINSDNDELADDAADLSVQVGEIAGKLKTLYESNWQEGSNHVPYDEILKQ
ncbi:hypothetical protein ACSV5M_10195 [Cellvibrio sp. ARAG 10.3]|uniref:hypothetical protein n=1 Tax=Cellvibrio sp. ARAG 10.3 TaxID=3451358 RepID=UPI003F46DDB5